MPKTLLITGSTDGIGLEAAKKLTGLGHQVLLHGRNPAKLEAAKRLLSDLGSTPVRGYLGDLSRLDEVEAFAARVLAEQPHLDVLINNAGVFKTSNPVTESGLDVRFVVNTLAPVLLTRRLLPSLGSSGRVINLSSAAQNPVDLQALLGQRRLSDFEAYGQSKLAITAWSRHLAERLGAGGPTVISVNPGSMLGSKMVRQGFGVAGRDIGIGADILVRLAVGDADGATGRYYDNDSGQFATPHPDALHTDKTERLMSIVDRLLSGVSS
ncbi:MAG: SDR family NAD(P)-dependent oxidoreductase [Proteobacteria bacterium]|nr:SDR family NAD(P)-dependent oxidoreductase [Pseudomonadota bacterium]